MQSQGFISIRLLFVKNAFALVRYIMLIVANLKDCTADMQKKILKQFETESLRELRLVTEFQWSRQTFGIDHFVNYILKVGIKKI